eukprot:5056073-Prymnesium_polylepis.1
MQRKALSDDSDAVLRLWGAVEETLAREAGALAAASSVLAAAEAHRWPTRAPMELQMGHGHDPRGCLP